MSPKRIGPIAQAWYKWKALRLPWRKNFLVGFDLEGNTYWEFRLTRGPGDETNNNGGAGEERWRRIVRYPRSTHLSDVKVSPQWHQWLRHTRRDPPPLEEQRGEVLRQARMRQLAAAADARWEAKPRLVGEQQQPQQQQLASTQQQQESHQDAGAQGSSHDQAGTQPQVATTSRGKGTSNDPWARAKAQGPSENWQPTTWDPTAPKTR